MTSASEFWSRLNTVDLNENGHKTFLNEAKSFLEQYPVDYVRKLRAFVRAGEKRCFHSFCMVHILHYCNKGHLLLDKSEQSILHLTATFHGCHRLIEAILYVCPALALLKRCGEHSGLTALHILVSKDAVETTQHFLGLQSIERFRPNLMSVLADGNRFKKTNLMGQTALSAAVLNFSTTIAVALLDAGANLMDQNTRGDTALHSLVRYANLFPAHRDAAIEMMSFLQAHILLPNKEGEKKLWGKRYARKVWFCRNHDNMTALQLAATLGEHKIVGFIMDLQWVYRTLYDYNGIFETNLYDITEIDTLAGEAWHQHRSSLQSSNCGKNVMDRLRMALCCSRTAAQNNLCGPPVIEVICEVDIASACQIISTPVVTKIIRDKWETCKALFYVWMILHLFQIIYLTVYANIKFKYLDDLNNSSSLNGSNTSSVCHGESSMSTEHPGEKMFLDISSALIFLVSIFTIYLEFIRSFVQRKPWNLRLKHHNGSFRFVLLLKAMALFFDSFWYFVCPKTNDKTPLVLALLLGWWFCTFFLRPFKIFSFFTVMLMRVLLGDMLRFFSIILIELISFTLVMHLLFQNNFRDPPEEFATLAKSFMTMFQLMLGLADLKVLHLANPAWLATALFVIYILLTYVLLINSLIAMMSITCAEIAGERANQWKIQRLSVILFLEKLLPCGLARLTGKRLYYHKRQGRRVLPAKSQGEMRYVITDTKSSKKFPSAFGVERGISQDLDDVDTDLEDEHHNNEVIVSCPDDDTPSQPPTPTASMGEADFEQIGWLNKTDFDMREADSGPYEEVDSLGRSQLYMSTLGGDHRRSLSRPSDLAVYDQAPVEDSRQRLRKSLQKQKSMDAPSDKLQQDDGVEYISMLDIENGGRQDSERPAAYSDPQWAALLESIRSFYCSPRPLSRVSYRTLSPGTRRSTMRCTRITSKKIRDEFIFEGRKKSVDDMDDIDENGVRNDSELVM